MLRQQAEAIFLDTGRFRIDVGNRLLLCGEREVTLTPKAFDTLLALAERPGVVLSKDELLDAVWPGTAVTVATLTQNVYTVRRALADHDTETAYIETLPRRGYRFVQAVRRTVGEGSIHPDGTSATSSMAVLPLRALETDDEAAFLGLGLADALITSLNSIRSLAVRPTSTMLRYVGSDSIPDPVAIGRQLGLDRVLEGTVQRHADRLRVTVQLVSVARGVPVWADQFTAALGDPFKAQETIAQAVVGSLRSRLDDGEEARPGRRPTHSLEAQRAFVRGRFQWNRRTGASLRRAIELFRLAIDLDPEYAQAHAGLADALILLPMYTRELPAEAFRQAQAAARRALELDADLAEAETSLAYTEFLYARRWQVAEDGFRSAIERNPHYPTAYHWYAFLLSALGRHQEAIDLGSHAQQLDPLSLVIGADLGMSLYFARRHDDALAQFRAVLEIDRDFAYAHFGSALTASALARHPAAIVAGRRAVERLPESTAAQSALGFVLAAAGQGDEARAILESLEAPHPSGPAQASHRALIHTGLGDRQEAIAALRIGLRERSRFISFLAVWPVFDSLRDDPSFESLLAEVGLSESPLPY